MLSLVRRGTNLNKPVKEKISLFFSSSSLFSSTLKQTTQKTRFFSHSLSSFSPLSSSSRLLSRNLFFSTLSSLKCSRNFSPSLKKFSLRLPKSSLSSLSSLRRNLSPPLFLFSLSLGHVLAEEERERKENDLEKERERKEEEEETIFEEREKICAESTESALYWILQMIAKDGLWWLATALFAVAGAVTGMMIPKSIAQLLDIARTLAPNGEGQVAPDLSVLYSPAAKVGGLFLLESICNFCFFSCLSSSSLRLEARMRTSVFAHLLRQDIAQFDQIRIGEFVSTASSDVEQVRMACKESIALGLRNCLRVGGYIYVLYSTSSKLTFALSLMIPTVISAGTLYARFLRSLSKTIQNATAHETAMMEEVLGNVRTVRSFANEDEEEERFLERLSLTKDLRSKFGIFIGGFQSSSSFAINGLAMIVFCYGGSLVFSGEMTVGQLTSFIMYANNLQRALSKLSILFGHISKASGSASRILELLRMGPMIPVKGGMVIRDRDEFWRNLSLASKMQTPQERERGEGEGVEFEGVFFQYPSRPEAQVLSDISLNLKPGSVTALVGMSGSGKSTMAALLQRFYDPTEGKIYVNGIDIKRLDPTWWRNGIGVVGQEPVLFSCSIADNIRYGKPDATHQEIMEAAKMANCHEFISEFRDGYDTPVGERGAQLSGGQRQRIAIARAILKDPQILILDEATSALDAKSEEAVQNALDKLMEHRTVLVIAHRLSTIQSADCIVVMQGGKILEKGKHTDLLSKDGNYADLIRSQVSSPTEDQ